MTADRIGIVGGGIVGLAIGRELLLRYPGLDLVVFEKEADVATHQTGHNSGVVHAGIYYQPGSLKAELCTEGRRALRDYCREHSLPFRECGKLVVAVSDDELDRLDRLERLATENGVPGLRRLQRSDIADLEPHAVGLAALHSPETAITDFGAVARSYASDIAAHGGRVRCAAPATDVVERGDEIDIVVAGDGDREPERVSRVVICGGLQADRIGPDGVGKGGPVIVPFRGEYFDIRPDKRDLVRGLIYPVPDPRYPFLGVHFTRRIDGRVDIGPNAILALAREGYGGRLAVDRNDLADLVRYRGFWRLAARHWRTGVREVVASVSMRRFMRAAQRYVPEIGPNDVARSTSGIRAQAVDRDGTLVDDFRITTSGRVVAIRNAPSPAATSSLAIPRHVVNQLDI